jgi:hypothetical protein
MPRPTHRRRQPKADQHDSIFDALNLDQDTGKQKEPPKEAKGPSIDDLMKQIADMNKRQEELERANMALSTAAPIVSPTQVAEPKLNLENLPDPIVDRVGYGQELAKRTLAYQQDMAKYAQSQMQPAPGGNFQQLWEDFTTDFAPYAEDEEGIEFAVTKVKRQAERRGLDVNKYMFQNRDRFFQDVVKVYDERFGKPGQEDGDEDNSRDTQRRQRGAQRRDMDDANGDVPDRTQGIFGGIDASGGNRAPRAPQAGDLIKDLQDIQRKTGYF